MIEMGDRTYIKIRCAYCNHLNNPDNDIFESGVYYAPTSGFDTFKCERCDKINFINSDFKAVKIEEIELKDVVEGFLASTSVAWTEKKVNRMCKEHLADIKEAKNEKN